MQCLLSRENEMNLIGAIISIDEKGPPPRGKGLAVYAITVVLCCNEGLVRHHIQHRLVLASGETQTSTETQVLMISGREIMF